MRKEIKNFIALIVLFWGCFVSYSGCLAKISKQDIVKKDFYERFPHMKKFFPFGVFMGNHDGTVMHWEGDSPEHSLEILLDVLSDHYINFVWGNGVGLEVDWAKRSSPTDYGKFGRWAYGKEYPNHSIRVMPSADRWFGKYTLLFKPYKGRKELLTDEEEANLEIKLKDKLNFMKALARKYPQTIVGFIIDDEPGPAYLVSRIAAANIVERHTKAPALFCVNSLNDVFVFSQYFQCLGGDWYCVDRNIRDNWEIGRRMRELAHRCPELTFWFIPLGGLYGSAHDTTRPGLPNTGLSQTEFRFQIWQALAYGAKGIVVWTLESWPFGRHNMVGMLDPLLLPTKPAKLIDEFKEIGKYITAVGPLLLPCKADFSVSVKLKCSKVSFPEFEGPALDCGILKDSENDRVFLVPFNNDIEREQQGILTLPKCWSRLKVYNLRTLKEINTSKRHIQLNLPPGGGEILLVSNPKEFKVCKDIILANRTRAQRISAWKHLRLARDQGLKIQKADNFFKKGLKAEKQGKWQKAVDAYQKAIVAVRNAEDESIVMRTVINYTIKPDIKAMRKKLNRIANILSESNNLIAVNKGIFNLLVGAPTFSDFLSNKFIGKQANELIYLIREYYRALDKFRHGQFLRKDSFNTYYTLLDELSAIENLAEKNLSDIKRIVKHRLIQVRKPIKLAFVTSNRKTIEFNLVYSRAFENFYVRWFTPNNKGKFCDRKGQKLKPKDFDVIWIHQLRFARKVTKNQKLSDIESIIMPQLLNLSLKERIMKFVDKGGGLFLSGIAGVYATILGIETKVPNRIRQSAPMVGKAVVFKIMPRCGFENHPIFKGFNTSQGIYTNDIYKYRPLSLLTECAWEGIQPSGTVIALQEDNANIRNKNYAAIIEYHFGRGKVLVFGGLSVNIIPGWGMSIPDVDKRTYRFETQERMKKLTWNAIEYLAQPTVFKRDKNSEITKQRTKSLKFYLPMD